MALATTLTDVSEVIDKSPKRHADFNLAGRYAGNLPRLLLTLTRKRHTKWVFRSGIATSSQILGFHYLPVLRPPRGVS
jgi:hypothetical protein